MKNAGILITIAIAAIFLLPAELPCAEEQECITIFLYNGDHIFAQDLTLLDSHFTIRIPYADELTIDKKHVLGLAYQQGEIAEITEVVAEKDTVKTTKGEVISGTIESIQEDGLKIRPSFAPENISTISLNRISHITFKGQNNGKSEIAADANIVKVIFINGDLLTGTITGFADGTFQFKPLLGSEFSFAISQYQTIHNVITSKQIFEGGLAAAIVELLKKAGDTRSYGNNVFVAVVRGLINDKDLDGVSYIYDHLSEFLVEPYIQRQLADEFYRNELYELSIKAYSNLFDSDNRFLYDYEKLIKSYEKLDRIAEAAEACEKILGNTDMMTRQGKNPIDLHLMVADLYIDLDNFPKAAKHLEAIIADPGSKDYKRTDARKKLIELYEKQGKLDTLISDYNEKLEQYDKTIGEGTILLIARYMEQGKITKAKVEFQRLKTLGMEEYVARAEEIMSEIDNID